MKPVDYRDAVADFKRIMKDLGEVTNLASGQAAGTLTKLSNETVCRGCIGRGYFLSRKIVGRPTRHTCNMCGGSGASGAPVRVVIQARVHTADPAGKLLPSGMQFLK